MKGRDLTIGFLLGLGVVIGPLYCKDQRQIAVVQRLEHAVDSAKAIRTAVTDTITVYVPVVAKAKAESDRLAGIVLVSGDGELTIKTTPTSEPEIVAVPPEVTELIQAQQKTIGEQASQLFRYEAKAGADSAVITAQDSLIVELKKGQKCGMKCGVLIGAGSALVLKLLSLLL